jgi:hypothetical protein
LRDWLTYYTQASFSVKVFAGPFCNLSAIILSDNSLVFQARERIIFIRALLSRVFANFFLALLAPLFAFSSTLTAKPNYMHLTGRVKGI